MRRRAIARRGVVELAGRRLGERDQLGDRARRQRGMHDQHVGLGADQDDGRQILDRVVRQIAVEAGVGRQDGVVAHQQRVAVGRRLGDDVAGEVAAGAGAIVGDHRLAEPFVQFLADGARQQIAPADRPARVFLSACASGTKKKNHHRGTEDTEEILWRASRALSRFLCVLCASVVKQFKRYATLRSLVRQCGSRSSGCGWPLFFMWVRATSPT